MSLDASSRFGAPGRRAQLVVLGVLAFFYYCGVAATRLVDGDEGYLLYAARLVLHGALPYRDFFYPQMPLFPYWLGALMLPLGGASWIGGRVAMAALATAAAALMFFLGRRRLGPGGLFAAWWGMYLISDFGLEWAVTIKTELPCMLAMLTAHALLQRTGARNALLAGLSAGLAIGTRWTSFPIALFILLPCLGEGRARRTLGPYAVGLSLMFIAIGFFALRAPFAFYYENYVYHTLEEPQTWGVRLAKNWGVFWQVLHNPVWIACGLGLILKIAVRWPARRTWLAAEKAELLSALWICLVSIIPVRAYEQYFCMAMPWLLLAAARTLPEIAQGMRAQLETLMPQAGRLVAAVLIAVALLLSPLQIASRRWQQLLWQHKSDEAAQGDDWRLGAIRYAERNVARLMKPGEQIVSWWPGYAIDTPQTMWPGLENHFALRLARYAPPEVTHQLGLMTLDDLDLRLKQNKARTVIVGNWAGMDRWTSQKFYIDMLWAGGYRVTFRNANVWVFQRTEIPGNYEDSGAPAGGANAPAQAAATK